AQEVIRRPHVGDPVAQGFVDRVLQGAAAGLDRDHARAEQAHAKDVERLALDVLGAHVHLALEPEQRRGGGGRHAVLAGARLRDHPPLAHPLGQQGLAEHVIDLVRAGMAEVLALEIDARAAALLAEPLGEVERRRPAGVVPEQVGEPALEFSIALRRGPGLLELDQWRHERLGDEAAAEAPEVPARVRKRPRHRAPLASATNRQTMSGSLRPGCASTPEFTSTPYGCAVATARATFSGVRPAERVIRHRSFARSRAIDHSIGWRASPSLQRAALSSKSADACLRYCRNFTVGAHGRMPPSSSEGAASLTVLVT